jgi:iron complex outermembrane receptor protein
VEKIAATHRLHATSRRVDLKPPARLCLALFLFTASCLGQQSDLADKSVEDLMNINVTSVSKKEQQMSQVAAAIFVITQEDIARSGGTNIPDLLRMVPGLDVAQINGSTWAISARGFNQQFANKLLVLVDGRAVYTPLFAGVNWDTVDVPLEDIDRIEVIRGPGATVWGANAVNGVINIITKKAADTPDALLTAIGGMPPEGIGLGQYGGRLGTHASYRVFTKYMNQNQLLGLTTEDAGDNRRLLHGGFRMDQSLSAKDSLTVEGDLYSGREGAMIEHIVSISPPDNETVARQANLSGGNVLGRWDHAFSNRSDTTLQFYFDKYTRSGPEVREARDTFDFDFQHHLALGSRQDLIWGVGYRHSSDRTNGTIDEAFLPEDRSFQLFNSFLQDELTLKPNRLFLTVGVKLEHNDFSGFEVQPGARVAWTPNDRHTLWAAVSRASRTPSRTETAADINVAVFPGPGGTPAEVTLFGNPHLKSEDVVAYEVGYRARRGARVSVDVATFFNVYGHLANGEPGSPFVVVNPPPLRLVFPLIYGNKLHGTTEGTELAVNWKVMNRWRLTPGYSLLLMHLHADPATQDTTSAPYAEGSSPRHQAQMRSHVDVFRGFAWDTAVYFVERLPAQPVTSYTRLDTQLSWRLGERAAFSLVGENLLRDHHVESNATGTSVDSSRMKRSAYARITCHF